MKGLRELIQTVLITADKKRLTRIPGNHYTTGDAQDWTYEYTIEDYNAALTMWPTAIIGSPESNLKGKILQYFYDNPEIALKNGIDPDRPNSFPRVY